MAHDLLTELHRLGVRLRLGEDGLDVLAPAGSLTDELRDRLRQERDGLIDLLRRAQRDDTAERIVPRPADRYEPFPLTDIQHAYWVGRNPALEMGGTSTHAYLELASEGLDLDRLAGALRKVIDRHDMLRAVVEPSGQQRVLPEVPAYDLRILDLRGLADDERDAEIERVRDEMSHQILPADRWPLFDIRATRTGDRHARLHLSLDMLIMDGFSMDLLFQEWRRFYEDPAWSPEPLGVTYRDAVLAQLARQDGEEYSLAEQYWLNGLDELSPPPELPVRPRPGRAMFHRRHDTVPEPGWTAIKAIARRRGLTPSAVLMTAFTDVLRAWSKAPSFTLNLTLFDRPPVHPQIDRVIGDFTSVTMLTADARPDESFATRCGNLHRRLARNLDHLAYSGVRVLRERARRLGGAPGAAMPVVFTSMLGAASDEGLVGGLRFLGDVVHGVSQTPQVWLDHQVAEEGGDLHLSWDSAEELFPPGMLDDMFGAYRALVARLAEDEGFWDDADAAAIALPAWQETERRAANDTAAPIPERTLCELVETQVERSPNAVAVIADDGQYTYAELANAAHRLAHRLVALDASRDELVAVVMGKGRDQIASVLGITRAGAAYLPIDPDWPQARREQLLERCAVRIVVTTPQLRDEDTWPDGLHVITFADADTRDAPTEAPQVAPSPEDLAYVIFTSGSTGRPKGVVIEHRAAANTVQDINARFGVGPDDRVLALSSLSFDLSVYDVFGTLSTGAAMVIPSASEAHDPAHWTDLVRRHGVTVWNSVPALMQAWVDSLESGLAPSNPGLAPSAPGLPSSAPGPRLVMLSGDWIPVSLPDSIRAQCPGADVISLGGATEASIWSVFHHIREVPPDWTRIPYGKPLANQTLHVYDERLEPCPVWATGEIYIGGKGVAKGYWGDEERTAERFIVHPRTGERLYRTGDLGRYLPGGDIDFLGREDFQVKLNGYRIELGEIEAELARQPGIAEAVVGVDASPRTGRRQLVGYVVPEATTPDGAGHANEPDPGTRLHGILEATATALDRDRAEHAADLSTERDTLDAANTLTPLVIARAFADLGFFLAEGDTVRPEEIVAAGVAPQYAELVERRLSALVDQGMLQLGDRPDEYRCANPFDPAALGERIERGLADMAVDGPQGVLREYFAACADAQVALLRGEADALEFLLPGGDWSVVNALYADNPVSRVQNRTVARVVRSFVDAAPADRPVRVLEVGGGTGSTSAPVLAELPPDRVRYQFTDISGYFTGRARQRFGDAYPFVEYGAVDIDADLADQGIGPGSVDVLLGANVLHDARDLDRTLAALRCALAPGGLLVLLESTTTMLSTLVTVGFVEGLAQDRPRDEWRPPLLSVPEWRDRIEAAGFTGLHTLPGDGSPHDLYMHVLVAEAPSGASAAGGPDLERLRQALEKALPEYMVPRHLVLLDRLPLSSNGKVDRSALPSRWEDGPVQKHVGPRDPMEQRLFDLWSEVLGRTDFGVDDDFFELGGDSLHVVSMLGPLREDFGLRGSAQEIMAALLDGPTVAGLAATVAARSDA
ncbi:non-ribosomal peptide synthetase [Actinomadura meridiana]|uniref:Phenyloxazoline synthase MbtB n=1 Tax=Actinomadura meridiana TaxID=559626 RepID=A0ABP8C2B9_9ACTN